MSVSTGDAALPPGFRFRAPTMDDLPGVVAVWRAEEAAIDGKATTTETEIRMYWNDPDRNLAEENRVVVDENDRIVAVLDTYDFPPYTVAEFNPAVHPDFCGRGIGSALLAQVEAYILERIERVQGPRLALHSQVSGRHERAHALLQRHGFSHIRNWRKLEIDLNADAPPVIPPDGLRLASLRLGVDERAIWEAAEEAWQDHFGYAPMGFEEFIYYRVTAIEDFHPDLWIVAWDENTDEIAGVSLCRRDTADDSDMGWVSLLAVRRPWRGRGLGSALLQASFAMFREQGWTRAGLAVDASSITGADRLYERAGMHEVRRDYIFEKVLREGPDAEAAAVG